MYCTCLFNVFLNSTLLNSTSFLQSFFGPSFMMVISTYLELAESACVGVRIILPAQFFTHVNLAQIFFAFSRVNIQRYFLEVHVLSLPNERINQVTVTHLKKIENTALFNYRQIPNVFNWSMTKNLILPLANTVDWVLPVYGEHEAVVRGQVWTSSNNFTAKINILFPIPPWI